VTIVIQEMSSSLGPEDMALVDCGGLKSHEFYSRRLRLREAERVLLDELALNPEETGPSWAVGAMANPHALSGCEASEATAESSLFNSLEGRTRASEEVTPDMDKTEKMFSYSGRGLRGPLSSQEGVEAASGFQVRP
jgi:hypothetical protein